MGGSRNHDRLTPNEPEFYIFEKQGKGEYNLKITILPEMKP